MRGMLAPLGIEVIRHNCWVRVSKAHRTRVLQTIAQLEVAAHYSRC